MLLFVILDFDLHPLWLCEARSLKLFHTLIRKDRKGWRAVCLWCRNGPWTWTERSADEKPRGNTLMESLWRGSVKAQSRPLKPAAAGEQKHVRYPASARVCEWGSVLVCRRVTIVCVLEWILIMIESVRAQHRLACSLLTDSDVWPLFPVPEPPRQELLQGLVYRNIPTQNLRRAGRDGLKCFRGKKEMCGSPFLPPKHTLVNCNCKLKR